MSVIEGGVIRQTSVSQVERFDHTQYGACGLAFWFERKHDLRQEQTAGQAKGEAGHEGLAHYFAHGALRDGRWSMKKAVTGAVLKGELPKPGPDLLVEWRFSGQEKHHPTEKNHDGTPKWISLDVEKTLWLGGLPWEGLVDLAFRRGPIPEVWDHKFSDDIRERAEKVPSLIKTVQMPVYVLALLRRPEFADAKQFKLVHHYVSKKGVESFCRPQVVTLDQVLEQKARVEAVVEEMKAVARIEHQGDVPFNRKSCSAWLGCPHQFICTAYKENRMPLSKEEADLFGPPKAATPPPAASAPAALPDDPFADDPFADAPPAAVAPVAEPAPVAAPAPSPVPTAAVAVNDPAIPPPTAKKPGRKKMVIQDTTESRPAATITPEVKAAAVAAYAVTKVETGSTPAAEAAARAVIAAAPAPREVTDGPGWADVKCTECGTPLGKRPPGHQIDPSLCPNKAAHYPASKPAAGVVEGLVAAVNAAPDPAAVERVRPTIEQPKPHPVVEAIAKAPVDDEPVTAEDKAAIAESKAWAAAGSPPYVERVEVTFRIDLGPEMLSVLKALLAR